MGGYDGHHRQNTAEKYNYKYNQWSLIASMNVQRSDASATTLNSKAMVSLLVFLPQLFIIKNLSNEQMLNPGWNISR